MWFQPQASSTLCQQQATAKIYHKFKITKKKVERKNQNDKIKIKEHTTHPEPCTAAPFAFFLAINFSTELKLWLIVEPKEPCGGSPPPSCNKVLGFQFWSNYSARKSELSSKSEEEVKKLTLVGVRFFQKIE